MIKYKLQKTITTYGDESLKTFLEKITLDKDGLSEDLDRMTFKNEKECIENSLQVGIESPPKKIKLTITVKAEEDKK